MNDYEGARVQRVIIVIVTVIKDVVDDDNSAIIIAQRYPTYIVVAPVPTNPGWSPNSGGNPVPAQTDIPMPASKMEGHPAPAFVRHPSPAAERQPDPAAMIIGSPVRIKSDRHPNVAVGRDIGPSPMTI